jgi:hypothetical protein
MIDYNAFHAYLTELVGLYQRTRSTKGMSQLAQKHHCTAITRDQFYQMKLDKLQPTQVTPQLSRVIRDTIGKSDAKATLRESIGALNEGILAGSRISQGSDRTVQITITQPVQADVAVTQRQAQQQEQPKKPVLPNYRVGQVLYHKTADELFLVSRLLDNDRFAVNYCLMSPKYAKQIVFDSEHQTFWLGNENIRPAKGSEIARYLGALTQSGFEWEADNANGLFTVKGKRQSEQSVEVFASDIPLHDYDNTGIHSLPAISPSPYRFALGPLIPTDNGDEYMTECHDTQMLNAVVRQVKTAFPRFDHIRELFQYDMPTVCCSEEIKEYRVALVKDDNNGTCYWLARDRDVLRLLSWISFIV